MTGGASGIGRELCIELAKRGSRVLVADIDREGAEETTARILRAGGQAAPVVADMRDPAAVDQLIDAAVASGPLDYMFNNAGIIMFGEFRDMGHEDWRRFIESDVMSVVHGTASAYRVMIRQGHGHIVNVASVFGIFPFALGSAYSAVKHAVVGLSLAMRPEARGLGVKVSVACPGSVDSEVRKTYTIFKGDRDVFNSFILRQLTPRKTALKILRGVEKDKGLIAFPFYDLIPWWLYRLHPSANDWWQGRLVNIFRKRIRSEGSTAADRGREEE